MHRALFATVGVFVGVIGLILLLIPGSYIEVYAVAYDPNMTFAARRFAPALIGLAAILLLARTLPTGPFLSTLCLISAIVFLLVATTGVNAWATGVAKPAILYAAALEVAIAALFLWAARTTNAKQ